MDFDRNVLESIGEKIRENTSDINRILLKHANRKEFTQSEARTLAGLVLAYADAAKEICKASYEKDRFSGCESKEGAVRFAVQMMNSMAYSSIQVFNQDEE